MTYRTKALLFVIAALTLTGCASTGIQNNTPVQITLAPAIDVPYAEVIKDVPNHIGVTVRWGGQIIAVEDDQSVTRLTVLAYPLNSKGQPRVEPDKGFVGGRFIVETSTFDAESSSRFLTVYGPISSEEVLTNGKLTKTIPVVTALEAKEWTSNDHHYAGQRQRHRLPYNGLGYGLNFGYAHIGYDYGRYYGYANLAPFFYPYYHTGSRGFRSRRSRSSR